MAMTYMIRFLRCETGNMHFFLHKCIARGGVLREDVGNGVVVAPVEYNTYSIEVVVVFGEQLIGHFKDLLCDGRMCAIWQQ